MTLDLIVSCLISCAELPCMQALTSSRRPSCKQSLRAWPRLQPADSSKTRLLHQMPWTQMRQQARL